MATPRNGSAFCLALFFLSVAALFLSFSPPPTNGANILAISYVAFPSHTFVFSKIGRALTAKGHNFTQLVSSLNSENLAKDSGINYVVYDHPFPPEQFLNFTRDINSKPTYQQTLEFVALSKAACKKLFSEEIKHQLLNMQIDLVLVDTAFTCSFLVADFVNASKRVMIAPAGLSDPWVSETHGVPVNPSHVPIFGSGLNANMNFEERLKNFVGYVLSKVVLLIQVVFKRDALYAEMGVSRTELTNTQGVLIFPTIFGFEYARSISPNTFFVGPLLAEDPTEPLQEKYQQWLDLSEDPVIIFSLGSAVYAPERVLKAMSGAVERLTTPDANGKKYRVIWKLRKDGLAFVTKKFDPTSVLIDDWIPQNDLLASKKIAAFLTHGGLNGVFESIFHSVPMVCMPFFGDQPDNCGKAEFAKTSLTVSNQEGLTADLLYDALLRVINEPSYKVNIEKLSLLVRDSGRTNAVVEKVEHVLKFGHQHLVNWSLWTLSWYELYCLDVIGFILGALFLVVGVPFLLVSYCLCYFACGKAHKLKKE